MRSTSFALSAALLASACVAQPPTDNPGTPDAGGGSGSPDAAPIVTENMIAVSGTAMDYFGDTPIEVSLTAEGVTPAATGSSDALGAFTLNIPAGSTFFLNASKPAFRTTRSAPIAITDTPVTGQNVYIASSAEVLNQYTGLGLTAVPATAAVFVNLVRNNGTPLEGVPLADITLVDALGAPVPGVMGPYFFGLTGNLVDAATLAVSTAVAGRARVGFLDCPVGSYEIKVNYQNAQNQPQTFTVPVTCAADGLTLAATGDMGGGGGGLMNLTFTADIYPILQRPAINPAGRACAAVGCHNQGGLAPIRFDDLAANVHAAIIARPGVVSLLTPADSLILTKPLYELPPALQNHPNATFLTVEDNDYKKILAWIQQGAPI